MSRLSFIDFHSSRVSGVGNISLCQSLLSL
eukprot:COSAG02_NODE_46456_length_348_cov_2.257028_2_plen_29_part_01